MLYVIKRHFPQNSTRILLNVETLWKHIIFNLPPMLYAIILHLAYFSFKYDKHNKEVILLCYVWNWYVLILHVQNIEG